MRGLDAFQSVLSHLLRLHALDVGSEGGEGACLVLTDHNRLHITTAAATLSHANSLGLDGAHGRRALLRSAATRYDLPGS